MAWLYLPSENSVGSAAAAGSTSPSNSPAHAPSLWVTVNGKPTQRPLSWRGWKTRPWAKLLSGTRQQPSHADSIAERWISSWQDSPALPSRPPARGRAMKTSGGSGPSSRPAFAKWNREGSFSKTSGDFSQLMLDGNSERFLEIWPPSGSMSNGFVSLREMWAPLPRGSESLSWPTPNARDYKGSDLESRHGGASLSHFAETGERCHSSPQGPTTAPGTESPKPPRTSHPRLNPAFVCWLMGSPFWWTRAEQTSCASAEMGSWLSRARQLLRSLTGDSEQA